MIPRFITTMLTATDVEAGFASGVHALDDYFRRHALRNQLQGISVSYVLRTEPSSASPEPALPAIIGFYSLSMTSIPAASVAAMLPPKTPRYDMPAALLGRLAIHRDAQGRGYGEQLLMDAITRVLEVAAHVGCVGVVVDAKSEAAAAFYSTYDFRPVGEGFPKRMFVPMATLKASIAR